MEQEQSIKKLDNDFDILEKEIKSLVETSMELTRQNLQMKSLLVKVIDWWDENEGRLQELADLELQFLIRQARVIINT